MKKSNGALETRVASALNMVLTDYQVSNIIEEAQKRIDKLMHTIEEKKEPLQKAFEAYEKLQNEHDFFKKRLSEDETLLDNMSRYKNGIAKHVPMRLLRSESHNDMKDREVKKLKQKRGPRIQQFTWTAYAVAVLQEQQRLLSPDDLWTLVGEKNNIEARLEELGMTPKRANIKWGAIHACWEPNCKMVHENSKHAASRGKLFQYNGYFGLKEWATDDFQPKPEYSRKELQKAV